MLIQNISEAQPTMLDSLRTVINSEKEDTTKINNLIKLAWIESDVNLSRTDSLCQIIINLSTKLNFIKGRSAAYNTLGKVRILQNNPKKSIEYYQLAAKDHIMLNNTKGLATVYSNLGNVYGDIGLPEKALFYYYKSLKVRKRINDERGMGDSYNNLGVIYKNKGSYDSAIYYHNLALKIRTKINFQGGIAYSYVNLSSIYIDFGDYKTGLDYLLKSLPILEKENDQRGYMLTLSQIAENNIRIKDYSSALKYVQKSLDMAEKGGFKYNLSNIFRIFSAVYSAKGDYHNAKMYAVKAYLVAKEINDAFQMTQILSQLSNYYYLEKKFYAADTCLNSAINLSRKNGFENELASYLVTFSNQKLSKNITDGVLEKLDEASLILQKSGNLKSGKIELYQAYSNYYKLINNYKKSLDYYTMFNALKDTIYNNNVSEKLQQLLTVYEADKKDKQIKILQQQALVKNYEINEKTLLIQRRNLTIIVIIITILLLIIAVVLYTRFEKLKNNKKQFALIKETEIFERKRIAKDIHDELGSGLTKIKFISEILQQQNQDTALSKNLRTISETVYSLVDNMRDLIWALNPNNTTLDNLLARIREYCSEYIEEIEIDFTFDFPEHIPDVKINNQAHRNIFLTIKEALQNTIKHSNAKNAQLEIRIENEKLFAKYSDNGKGFNTDKNRSLESNGMLNMRHRIETLGGVYSIKSTINEGTIISFEIKLSDMDNKITL